jgi:ribose 5-phosphate isomerase B
MGCSNEPEAADANVLAISLKRTAPDVAVDCVKAFLSVDAPDPEEAENIGLLKD